MGGRPAASGQGVVRLGVTLVANVASSYALEGVSALCAGAFGLLDPLRHVGGPALLLAVLASYTAWLGGLALNVHGNWRLLERESVSVSVTSKLLHDTARRLTGSRRVQYGAAAFGFVIWEAVKEVPWLLATIGVEAAAGSHHGWSFLAGSNVGAMGYNLVQAGITLQLVRPRTTRKCSALSWRRSETQTSEDMP